MFKPQDKYIHFTKYGGVNKGEVEWYGTQINWDTDNMVAYHIPYIKSTKGIVIHLNGEDGRVFKIKEDITEEMLRKLKSSSEVFKVLKERKEQIKKASIENAEKRVNEVKEYLNNSNIEEVLKKYEDGK
jgi:hypothetical protein